MKRESLLSLGLLVLRMGTGLCMAYHGYGKIFGGYMEKFVEGVAKMGFPMPEAFAWAAALSEFAGGIALALGLATRASAFLIFVTMSVAFFITHRADAFQIKELAFAYWVTSLSLIFTGAGSFSLDRYFFKKS